MCDEFYFGDIVEDVLRSNLQNIPCSACNGSGKHISELSLDTQILIGFLQIAGGRTSTRLTGEDCLYCDGTGEETDLRKRAAVVAKRLNMPEYLVFQKELEVRE